MQQSSKLMHNNKYDHYMKPYINVEILCSTYTPNTK